MIYHTKSATETEQLGERLAQALQARNGRLCFVAMYGDLGVGKTAFVRGFCRFFGIRRVKSPTYTVINEYAGDGVSVYHLDMYRLSGEEDLESIGYYDHLSRGGYMLCEWSERLENHIPEGAVTVTLKKTDDGDGRQIEIEGVEI